jgi:hypothetical protein
MMSGPPPKASTKSKPKLPPKTRKDKVTQAIDTNRTYTLNTGGRKRGKKIIVYGASGMGKTTLATMLPKPVFVAVDDGIDEIVHPVTGEVIPNYRAMDYQDVRNILGRHELFDGFETVVVDTITEVESMAIPHILEHVKKDGKTVTSLEGYGWGAGYGHLADHDNYVKNDLQRLAQAGFNVVILAQSAPRREAQASVDDYIKDGPKLVYRPGSKAFAVTDFVEWADHCFRIGYSDIQVSNKRASTSGERVIFVHPDATFEAKSRTIPLQFPLVSFSDPTDDSIWKFVFEDAWKDVEVDEDE